LKKPRHKRTLAPVAFKIVSFKKPKPAARQNRAVKTLPLKIRNPLHLIFKQFPTHKGTIIEHPFHLNRGVLPIIFSSHLTCAMLAGKGSASCNAVIL
jgi:hypothetical protein